jgi:uncharacterized protein (DUF58 family)
VQGVIAFFALLALIALLINGVVYLVVNFWWVLLIVLAGGAVWLSLHHPGVRAKRELRQAVKNGDQQRMNIRNATEQTKADMVRIARNWQRRS